MRRLIERLFGRGPVLRNRAGGMAWIRGVPDSLAGAAQLNNRAVKTVRIAESGNWAIEPAQFFIATRPFIWDVVLYLRGDAVGVRGVADACLEPWKEDGITHQEVRELYAGGEQNQRLPVYTYDDLPRQAQK